MAVKQKGLGKGLGALFPDEGGAENFSGGVITGAKEGNNKGRDVVTLKVIDIEPNRSQPRQYFDKEKLDMLTESVRIHGIIQPILVQESENGMYKIIAGERRWRAAKAAGLKSVPCIIKEVSAKEVMELALIENLQREDLNPVEEAEGYKRLMESFDLTQEELSERVGKSRSAVANILRLNGLSDEIKDMLVTEQITGGHARAILSVQSRAEQAELAGRIVKEGLSVRQSEEIVKKESGKKNGKEKVEKKDKPKAEIQNSDYFKQIEDRLSKHLTTKVRVGSTGAKTMKIEIDCFGGIELNRIMNLILE